MRNTTDPKLSWKAWLEQHRSKLGLAAALSLALPQLLRGEREPQLLSLTVLLRDTDS